MLERKPSRQTHIASVVSPNMGRHEDGFRGLYHDLLAANDTHERSRLLEDAQEPGRRQLDALAALRAREPVPARREDRQRRDNEQVARSWQLYALSRVSDYLLELGCPPGELDHGWTGGRRLAPHELQLHTAFLSGLGLERCTHTGGFSPFHHEIFAVVQDDTLDEVVLEDVLWSGFRFGALLFARAGVRVRAPATLVDQQVATTSTLFFTFRRQPRRTEDASQGWGHNSQWRTRFSRFYADAEGFHLNWDGSVDLAPTRPRRRQAIPRGSQS